MNYRLDHIALNCKNLREFVSFYEKHFGGRRLNHARAAMGEVFVS